VTDAEPTAPPPFDVDQPESRAAPPRRAKRREWPVLLALSLLISVALKIFVVQVFYIPSGSMEKTLHGCSGCHNNDRVVVEKVSYRFHPPRRGDVIVFDGRGSFTHQPGEKDFVKRVIGLPGDVVACCDPQGRVTVNDVALDEPYLFEDVRRPFDPVTVPGGRLWVMGDHRCCSEDSRDHGPIPIGKVVGRAVVLVWPPSRIGGID
jgi:signal peptidase I